MEIFPSQNQVKKQIFISAILIFMQTFTEDSKKIINIIKFECCQEQLRWRCARNEVVTSLVYIASIASE